MLEPLPLSRSAIDRRAAVRTRPGLVEELMADPATRVLALRAGQARLAPDGPSGAPRLALVAPDALGGERDPAAPVVYLGRSEDGVEHLATALSTEPQLVEAERPADAAPTRWVGLRDVAADLPDLDAGLFTTAQAMLAWHAVHTHCPRCGAPTEAVAAGWVRRCTVDGSEHFPRTDPAVIMTVLDDEDRVLLGRNAAWPEGRWSVLAGFVEPGEPFEDAVVREVLEEAGVHVGEVTYLGSQPWPFPASLMIGCTARALSHEITVDGEEIREAGWFAREDVRAQVQAGRMGLPPASSIAHALLVRWYGGPLPTP